MSKYKMENGSVVDTHKATARYDEDTRWNGNNRISVNTGSQWEHETLYQSSKGRWYLVRSSQWQGSTPSAEWVDSERAAAWLALNNKEIPASLAHIQADE